MGEEVIGPFVGFISRVIGKVQIGVSGHGGMCTCAVEAVVAFKDIDQVALLIESTEERAFVMDGNFKCTSTYCFDLANLLPDRTVAGSSCGVNEVYCCVGSISRGICIY